MSAQAAEFTCIDVSIEDLLNDPRPYAGEVVCTSALVFLAEDSITLHRQDYPQTDTRGVTLEAHVSPAEVVERGGRSLDTVTVSGLLRLEQNCGWPEEGPAERGYCIPMRRPAHLDGATILEHVHVPYEERCTTLSVDQVLADIEATMRRMICIEAEVGFSNFDTVLLPTSGATPSSGSPRVVLDPNSIRSRAVNIPHERVSVIGYAWRNEICDINYDNCYDRISIFAFDLTTTEDVDPYSVCQYVALGDLIAMPAMFDGAFVCSSAVASPRLMEAGNPWGWLVDLIPLEETDAAAWPLEASIGSGTFQWGEELPYSGPPIQIEFAGRFYFDEECLELIEHPNDIHQCHVSPISIDIAAYEIIEAP